MTPECTDRKIGARLHAYELDLLAAEEAEQFELHLMKCDACLAAIHEFARGPILLRTDQDVVHEIERLDGQASEPAPVVGPARRIVFPAWLRGWQPAVAALLVVMLGATAYVMRPDRTDRPPQQVRLLPTRSAQGHSFLLSPDRDIEFVFIFEGSEAGHCYIVTVSGPDGGVPYRDSSFCDFTAADAGSVTLPAARFPAGRYRLLIVDPQGDPLYNSQEYRFTIRYTE